MLKIAKSTDNRFIAENLNEEYVIFSYKILQQCSITDFYLDITFFSMLQKKAIASKSAH